jgi:hypothetical protein
MDDVDDEVYFEITGKMVFNEILVQEIFDVIVNSRWFIQGNRTEGLLSIGQRLKNGIEINLDWKSITMGEDWDSDETEEHEKDFILSWDVDNKIVLTPRYYEGRTKVLPFFIKNN